MRSGKYSGMFAGCLTLIVVLLPGSANADPADKYVLPCYYKSCVLSFQTNADWEQKVRVFRLGSSWIKAYSGSGQRRTHEEVTVPKGLYHFNLEHKTKGDWKSFGQWRNSWVKRRGDCLYASDSGPKGDYTNAIVCLKPTDG